MKLIHFTNYQVAWSTGPFISTGFLKRICSEGFRRFSNFGLVNTDDEIRESFRCFLKHGIRCNKKNINGNISIPIAIIVEIPDDFPIQQGYDGPCHIQTNRKIKSSEIKGYFIFNPDRIIKNVRFTKTPKYPYLKKLLEYEETFVEEFENALLQEM